MPESPTPAGIVYEQATAAHITCCATLDGNITGTVDGVCRASAGERSPVSHRRLRTAASAKGTASEPPASRADPQASSMESAFLALLIVAAAALLGSAAAGLLSWARLSRAMDRSGLPSAPGGLPVLGHALALLAGRPYKIFVGWLRDSGSDCVRFRVLNKECVLVRGPEALKRVFQTKQRNYGKDTGFTYHPFMGILGTGLVTADGTHWQKQRLLIGPALRIDILDRVISIAYRAVNRLGDKLKLSVPKTKEEGAREAVNMEEEFRRLTLQAST